MNSLGSGPWGPGGVHFSYEFIGFGAIDGNFAYEFIRFGVIDCHFGFEFIRFGAFWGY